MGPRVTSEEADALRKGGAVLFCDVRFSLADPDAGRRAYLDAHLPGAVFVDLERDLSGPVVPGVTGRHPLPDVAEWGRTLGRLGIAPETSVVAYDDAGGAFAARLWWMLRAIGHERVAVLDGGFPGWVSEGREATREVPRRAEAAGRPSSFDSRWLASLVEVERRSVAAAPLLFDARAVERFRGENETIDRRPGRIPGARSLPFQGNLKEGRFAPPEFLRERFESVLEGASPSDAIVYCGSGVTACHLVLAAEVAGLPGLRLFPGSYSEWIADGLRPVELG